MYENGLNHKSVSYFSDSRAHLCATLIYQLNTELIDEMLDGKNKSIQIALKEHYLVLNMTQSS